MKYALLTQLDALSATDTLLVGICGKNVLPGEGLPEHLANEVDAALKRGDASSKAGRVFVLSRAEQTGVGRIIIVGCGAKLADWDAAARDRAVALGTQTALTLGNKRLVIALSLAVTQEAPVLALRRSAQSAAQACYRFTELKSSKPETRALRTIAVVPPADLAITDAQQALQQAEAIASGIALASDLGNRPGNRCTPTDLARQAEKIAAGHKGMKVRILDEREMFDIGMHSLLSVSRGSREEARLIVLEWNGGKKGQKPLALVGKGLTFDAGGISLKPALKMEEMKFDMMGGASVLGAMQAAAELQLPLNIVAVVAASENLPDGAANKPGDVVTSLSGQTIEIVNTDAEGRLLLCDALTWVQKEFAPTTIVDLATLTGAVVVALGEHACGLFANDQSLADELLLAGQQTGDRAWQLPLWEDYQQQLDSPVADMQNIGGPGAGSVTAASFLHRFTRKARWAHLDIAGIAWNQKKLATGRPVSLLVQWLLNQAA